MTENEKEDISYHNCPCPKCRAPSPLISYDEGSMNGKNVLYNESFRCPTHGVWLYKWDDLSSAMVVNFISKPSSIPPK